MTAKNDELEGKFPPLTIGIATKNRARELVRCIRSISLLMRTPYELIIIDDGSDHPVEKVVRDELDAQSLANALFVRWDMSRNLMAARNEIVKRARGEIVLMLDDDSYLLDNGELEIALNTMGTDQMIGAMAFPECDADGKLKKTQPGKGDKPCFTTHFYGYAHAIKRDLFLNVGGYREFFGFYHEESDLCKKMLNLGHRCIYWPSVRIAHVPSLLEREGRDLLRFQFGLRNRGLDALCNEPLPLCVLTLSGLLIKYAFGERRFRLRYNLEQTGGPWWLIRELVSMKPLILAERAPLRWKVFLQWRWTRLTTPEYR